MQLIPISENILVNPDAISYIQKSSVGNKLTVNIGGKSLTVTVNWKDFVKDLDRSGVDMGDQFFRP